MEGTGSVLPSNIDVNILDIPGIEIKNDKLSVEIQQKLLKKKTKNQFLADIAFNIFYSRNLDTASATYNASNAIELAKVFYNTLLNKSIIKEKYDNKEKVYYIEY